MTLEEVAEAMGEELLAPGVYGNRFDTAQGIYIPVITAVHPGSGEVSRFLDNLPRDRTIKFPTVLSGRLRGMLLRRGFRDGEEFAPEFGETVQIMVRNAEVKPCP